MATLEVAEISRLGEAAGRVKLPQSYRQTPLSVSPQADSCPMQKICEGAIFSVYAIFASF
jgi:hypothetical protein